MRILIGSEGALALAILTGLLRRGRLRLCLSFVAYALTVVAAGVCAALWPDALYKWGPWLAWQTVQVTLKLAIMFELGSYIFRPFPGALAAVQGLMVLVLGTTAVALLGMHVSGRGIGDFALQAAPVASQGVAWGFALLLGLSTWYFVPMDSWRRAILIGMAIHGMLFTVALAALDRFGGGVREVLSYLNIGAYITLLGYWNVAAWRPVTAEDLDVERVRQELALHVAARRKRA
jgi:hypothetical protein